MPFIWLTGRGLKKNQHFCCIGGLVCYIPTQQSGIDVREMVDCRSSVEFGNDLKPERVGNSH